MTVAAVLDAQPKDEVYCRKAGNVAVKCEGGCSGFVAVTGNGYGPGDRYGINYFRVCLFAAPEAGVAMMVTRRGVPIVACEPANVDEPLTVLV